MSKLNKKGMTTMQKTAAKHLVANGGTVADSMRAAGYSESMARNPQKLTGSKGFIAILEKAGVTDTAIAKGHSELMQSAHIEHQTFMALKKETTVLKDNKGRPLKKPEKKLVYRHVPDEIIKMQIESVPGHVLLYIQKGWVEKVAYFKVPENAVRKGAIEMSYKVKGHFAPIKASVITHDLTEEEKQALLNLNDDEESE